MEKEFKEAQLKLICTSDSMKFFVFEGPQIMSKEDKEAKKEKKEMKKGDRKGTIAPKDEKKNKLLGNILAIKKEQEEAAAK